MYPSHDRCQPDSLPSQKPAARGEPVSRILSRGSLPFDDHSSERGVAARALAANPGPWAEASRRVATPRDPYLALLPVGLAEPVPLPVPRWALTPPFHPCPAGGAVCSLWRCPSGFPARELPGTAASWSPDFPPRGPEDLRRRPSSSPRGGRLRRCATARQRGSDGPGPLQGQRPSHPAGPGPRGGSGCGKPPAGFPGRCPVSSRNLPAPA